MSLDVQRAIRELLMANGTIQGYVRTANEDRIYPNIAREFRADENVSDYIVYSIIDRERARTLKGPKRLAHTRMQIDVYSRSYSSAHAMADAVEDATNGYNGKVANSDGDELLVRSIELSTMEDIYEASPDGREFAFNCVSIDLLIWHEKEAPGVASVGGG